MVSPKIKVDVSMIREASEASVVNDQAPSDSSGTVRVDPLIETLASFETVQV